MRATCACVVLWNHSAFSTSQGREQNDCDAFMPRIFERWALTGERTMEWINRLPPRLPWAIQYPGIVGLETTFSKVSARIF